MEKPLKIKEFERKEIRGMRKDKVTLENLTVQINIRISENIGRTGKCSKKSKKAMILFNDWEMLW